MGASDFVAGEFYTYDDVGPGQTDYGMRRFTIAHDQRQILPLLRQARRLNPKLKVIATPWSPPAWMKTNKSLVGGGSHRPRPRGNGGRSRIYAYTA